MAFNGPQQEIALIDEEIRILEDRLLHLRSTRNTLIPISRLPADVLQRIFNIARGQGTQTIHLSWVSHSWRGTTLGCKTLWTLINNSNLRWTSIYLERSSPALLTVNFEEPFRAMDLFSAVIQEIARIKALVLPLGDWKFLIGPIIQDALVQHGRSPLPHIDIIRLTQAEISREVLINLRNARHLSLAWCDHHWTPRPPPFPYLRSLCLSTPETEVSVHDLLDYLESMPALQHLVLLSVLKEISHQDSPTTRRSFAHGPKLTTLHIETWDFESSSMFLNKAGCIVQETEISLDAHLYNQPVDEIRDVLVAFDQWANNTGHTQGVTHLAIDTLEKGTIVIEYGGGGGRGCAHLRVKVFPHLNDRLDLVPILPQSLRLDNLQLLYIRLHMETSPWQLIIDAFGSLPHLQHLGVSALYSASAVDPLLAAITQVPNQTQGITQPLPFRALKALVFPQGQIAQEVLPRLHTFLQSRKSAGLKLETLGLAWSGYIDALRELIGPNLGDLVDNVVDAGGEDYLKTECYQFLGRANDKEEIPFNIL